MLTSGQSIVITVLGKVDVGKASWATGISAKGTQHLCDMAEFSRLANQTYIIDCLLTGAPVGAVVGKIGDSAPFVIGTLMQFSPGASGELFLGVNDCCEVDDNMGAFSVTISMP